MTAYSPPKTYADQWEILPDDPLEYRAAAIYEYARESPQLLKLAVRVAAEVGGGGLFTPKAALAELDIHSAELKNIVWSLAVLAPPKVFQKKWNALSKKDRRWLCESLVRPISLFSGGLLQMALGHKISWDSVTSSAPDIGETIKWSADRTKASVQWPPKDCRQVLLPLLIDASLTQSQVRAEVGKFLNTVFAKKEGRKSQNDVWRKYLSHLSLLRLLSSRSTDEARSLIKKHQSAAVRAMIEEDGRWIRRRVGGVSKLFANIFPVGINPNELISMNCYRSTHSPGRPRKRGS